MKKIILLILISITLVGCNKQTNLDKCLTEDGCNETYTILDLDSDYISYIKDNIDFNFNDFSITIDNEAQPTYIDLIEIQDTDITYIYNDPSTLTVASYIEYYYLHNELMNYSDAYITDENIYTNLKITYLDGSVISFNENQELQRLYMNSTNNMYDTLTNNSQFLIDLYEAIGLEIGIFTSITLYENEEDIINDQYIGTIVFSPSSISGDDFVVMIKEIEECGYTNESDLNTLLETLFTDYNIRISITESVD